MNPTNFKPPENIRPHWNYFLALEKDLEALSRYIEFCKDNLNTYSIELAHLLLSSASEIDTVAKCICAILEPNAKADNINTYRKIIKAGEDAETYGFDRPGKADPVLAEEHKHRLSALKIYIPRYNMALVPWESWKKDVSPDWWKAYNEVKHERNNYFNKATLRNVLYSLSALLAINYVYCRLEITQINPRDRYEYRKNSVTRHMQPDSTLLMFGRDFYDNPFAELGSHIRRVSEDVERLSRDLSQKE
jgi:hypothetical protein